MGEKNVKVVVRDGNNWKFSRTIRTPKGAERLLAELGLWMEALEVGHAISVKVGSALPRLIADNGLVSVVNEVRDILQAEVLPVIAEEECVKVAVAPALVSPITAADSPRALTKEEHAELEAAQMHEISCDVSDGLAHVQTVCDLLRQAALRARDMFGKEHPVVHTVLDPVLDTEEALQSMLLRLIIDSNELTERLCTAA